MPVLSSVITTTRLYNFDPLKPHFYIIKLGLTGVYTLFFLLLIKNIDCGYSLEPSRRGASNEYPKIYVFSRNMKYIRFVLSENVHFLLVKFSVYLNKRIFVTKITYNVHFQGKLSLKYP